MLILLFLVGLILIFLEFFLPGAVLGVMGAMALIACLVLVFFLYNWVWGMVAVALLLASVLGVCKLALWRLRKTQEKGDFCHAQDQEGYVAVSFDSALIGKEGIVATELKPAGHIVVEGRLYQALSEAGFIDKGTRVHIVGGKGAHLIVRG